MAQTQTIARKTFTKIGLESTYNTLAGTLVHFFCNDDGLLVDGLTQMAEVNNDERGRRADNPKVILGSKEGSKLSPLKAFVKDLKSTDLLKATGAVNANLSIRPLLTACLGTEVTPAVGDTVGAAPTTTSIAVTTPAHFTEGTWIRVGREISPSVTFDDVKIVSKTGSTLTLDPALPAAPTVGADVLNKYNYVPAEIHSNSLSVQRAFADNANLQYQVTGLAAECGIEFGEWSKPFHWTLSGPVGDWTGPQASILSTSDVDPAQNPDDLGAPLIFKPKVYFATQGTIVRNTSGVGETGAYRLESLKIEPKYEWEVTHDNTKPNAIGGYNNVGGRPVACQVTVTILVDHTEQANFTSQASRQMILIFQGTNATLVLEFPNLYIAQSTKLGKLGKRVKMELVCHALIDTTVTAAASPSRMQLDARDAYMRVALG